MADLSRRALDEDAKHLCYFENDGLETGWKGRSGVVGLKTR